MDHSAFAAVVSGPGAELLARLDGYDEAAVLATAERLRREADPAIVAAALTQARLRARAAVKFGEDARRMYFTPHGLEQATHADVAAHRAHRFVAAGVNAVADLCCGIGGDALALARAGVRVHAVDRDPLACAVAAANAAALGLADAVRVTCADVGDVELGDVRGAFIDPARRGARGRVFDPEAYAPPLSFAVGLSARVEALAVKTAPGIPHDVVPTGAEAEWVSVRGEVKEAALWFGPLATAGRRATLLPGGHTLLRHRTSTGVDDGPVAAVGPVGRYLYEPDGAVVRAGLVAEAAEAVGGRLLDGMIAYISGDDAHATPFATCYRVDEVMPFQLKRLRTALRERGVGALTIKKRGLGIDPAELRGRLRLAGPDAATLVLTRIGDAPTALLVTPMG